VFRDLVSGVSQRRIARNCRLNRKTVVRKFLFLSKIANSLIKAQLELRSEPVQSFQFDDLETFEHSKLKPLSVIMAVESKSRKILGFRVARMPAKGHLVARAKKKYGFRKDERRKMRGELFTEISPWIHPKAEIKSDESPHYPFDVKAYFPEATHKTYKGRRGCVVGQGELKGGGFDPIFSLNHTYAMLRANINRLFRRTWNTTKKPERLALHIALYSLFHNLELTK